MKSRNYVDKKNFCTFYIVRHGETDWNKKNIVQGHKDSPLTRKGIKQAELLAKELSNIKFDMIVSSDLLRAKNTAELIALKHNLDVKTSEMLRERNYGIFEGKTGDKLSEFNKRYIKLYKKAKYSHTTKEDIESNEHFINRFITFIKEISYVKAGKNILIVAHNGILTMLLIYLGFAKYEELPRGSIKNSALIKLLSNGDDFKILEIKDIQLKTKKPEL